MENTQNDFEPKEGRVVSRRDFLKRAGKEAVSTTVSMLPAAKIARRVLGDGTVASHNTPVDSLSTEEPNTETETTKPRTAWWGALAQWRRDRGMKN